MLFLVCGGAGSGKSSFSEDLVLSLHKSLCGDRKIYIATMQNNDCETDKKISIHRQNRKGKSFHTLEQPFNISSLCDKITKNDICLLECLSNLLANEMYKDILAPYEKDSLSDRIFAELMELEKASRAVVVVSNDVFRDGVSFEEYNYELGRLNCLLAQKAEETFEVASGIAIRHKIALI